jgi:hypothetical protein
MLWQGACQVKGYGLTCTGSRTDGTRRTGVLVHRIVWEAANGAIPDGLEVDRICRVRNCVEIAHLQLLTPHANKMRADHTQHSINLRARTHCKRNHEFTEANTRWDKTGRRNCRTCAAWHQRQYNARNSSTKAAANG